MTVATVTLTVTCTAFGSLPVQETAVTGAGQALNLTNGPFAAGSAFAEVTSTSGATGITHVGVDGNLTISAGSLSGSAGAEIDVDGGNGVLSYPGGRVGGPGPRSRRTASTSPSERCHVRGLLRDQRQHARGQWQGRCTPDGAR